MSSIRHYGKGATRPAHRGAYVESLRPEAHPSQRLEPWLKQRRLADGLKTGLKVGPKVKQRKHDQRKKARQDADAFREWLRREARKSLAREDS